MHKFGDVVLTQIQFVDTFEVKIRPALVLFEDWGNIVVAGITSNKEMDGISLSRKEGAIKESVIKLNYVFTVSDAMIQKTLFTLPSQKKNIVRLAFMKKLQE